MSQSSELPGCRGDKHQHHTAATLPPLTTIEAAAMMLRAAGDPARLRVLLLLADGERCVTEIAEVEGEKIATVSARLKQLHAARLVQKRREAKHIYYALADDHVVQILRDILDHASEDQTSPLKVEGART